eukprot:2384497-Prymnesium_polylepis.2
MCLAPTKGAHCREVGRRKGGLGGRAQARQARGKAWERRLPCHAGWHGSAREQPTPSSCVRALRADGTRHADGAR